MEKVLTAKINVRFRFMTLEGFTTLKVLCARMNSLKMKWTKIMGLLRVHFCFRSGSANTFDSNHKFAHPY